MRLVRCQACRTVCDGDRYLKCIGCSAILADASPVSRGASQGVRAAEGDARYSRGTLWILAGILLVSTLFAGFGLAAIPALGAFPLLVYLIGSQISRGFGGFLEGSPISNVIYFLLMLAAALIGAFLLVALACSVPMSQFP